MDNIFEQLEETYGLELILLQNDLENHEVIRILHGQGWIDLDDYIFDEMEPTHEDD